MKLPKLNSSLMLVISFLSFSSAQQPQPQQTATTLISSSTSEYGGFIEGASVNVNGDIFATNFNAQLFSIGTVTPSQSLYHSSSSPKTKYNGIRFLPLTKSQIDQGVKSVALLADMNEDRVTKIVEGNDGKIAQSTFFVDQTLKLPNDLAYSYQTDRTYISGQNFTNTTTVGDGGLWVCDKDGKIIAHQEFGRTNGIELSLDEKVLYLSEAFNDNAKVVSNKIWTFDVDQGTGKVSDQKLFVDFEKLDGTQSIDVDGMRIDVDGNLYVTRHGGSQVVVFSPQGEVLSRIDLSSIKRPTNLEFGGEDGKTLHIVGACKDNEQKGCVDTIQNDKAGRAITVLKSLNGKN